MHSPDRLKIRSAFSNVRHRVHKRDRLVLSGAVSYTCDCGVSLRVGLATAVIPLELLHVDPNLFGVPVPSEIPCEQCGEQASYEMYSFDRKANTTLSLPYLRIPSRRAMIRLVDEGRFEAQYVDPPGDMRGGLIP